MKKILLAVMAFLAFNIASFAQAAPATKKEPAKMQVVKKTETKKEAKVVSMPPAKTTVAVKTTTPVAAKTTKLKKDGTPDKRFKENQHLKKDGTPDLRYKENKKG